MKNLIITDKQLRDFKGRVLKEALAVNPYRVKEVADYVSKKFSKPLYDDIDDNGDVVERVAIQMLNSKGEPVQTISPQKMLDKLVDKFRDTFKIKDEEELRDFIRQVLVDWVDGKITNDGLLSVNSTGKKKD